MKSKIYASAAVSLIFTIVIAVPGARAREKWPAPTEEAKHEAAAARQHETELWKRLEPELAEWGKKGKPFIPQAAKPTDLPQADVPAFPGAEGGGMH